MKIFRLLQKQLAIVGITASSNESTINLSKISIVGGAALFCCIIIMLQFVYIFHVASSFMEYVECICSASGSVIFFIWFLTITFRQATLFECIDKMEKLIDTRCKYPKSMAFFSKTSHQVEQLSKISFMLLLTIGLQIGILPKCIISFVTYFTTDMGRNSFQLPFSLWFPFDPYSPIGYLIAVIIEYISFSLQMFVLACILAVATGAFWLLISTSKEIRRILHAINDTTGAEKTENQSSELKALFTEFIDVEASIKQLICDFSYLFQPIIMSLFTFSLLAIAGAMLIIQMKSFVWVMILNGFFAFVAVFIACELGQRMSDAFEKIDIKIDKFDWYLFPNEIQRMLPMIIANAQQEVQLECFGSIACTREVFKNIIHRSYTYFMVLRQLGA